MRRGLLAVMGILVVAVVAFLSFRMNVNRLPRDVEKLLRSSDTFTLFSLEPEEIAPLSKNDDLTFHGFAILGQAPINDASRRDQLVTALLRGVRNSKGEQYRCFLPRHGIRVKTVDKTIDLVICFQCGRIYLYDPEYTEVLTAGTASESFVAAIKAVGLKQPSF